MKVSIITCCYNSAATVEHAIQSVLSQDYPNIEYIIVDGLSKDNTLEVVSKYKDRIGNIISEKDDGIYDAINKGVRNATGDIVGLLHSDDFFSDNQVISRIVAAFNNQIDAVYGDLQYVAKDNPDKVIRNWISGQYRPNLFKTGWMPPHPTFYVRKGKYDELGLYNTELRISADYELMLRFIQKNGITVAYIPEVLVKMRVGGESNMSLKNRLKANMEDKRAWKLNNLRPGLLTTTLKPLMKIKQYFS